MGGEVKTKMRKLLPVLCAVTLLAACGRAHQGPLPNTGNYKLYEAASTPASAMVSVIDSQSRAVERRLPLGATSGDWTHLYTATGGKLGDYDPRTGNILHVTSLPGDYHLPQTSINGLPGGLSQNGKWLVLEAFDDTPDGPPSATHLLVVDTTYARPATRVDLAGYFGFDAITNDGKRMFLIQYLSGGIYKVRSYDVGLGLNPNVVFDKSDGSDAMTGLRISGVPSPDGNWLYSVYARENNHPFIHALDIADGIAFCVDLPGPGYGSGDPNALDWSLALSPDDKNLYAANGALGVVFEVANLGGLPAIARSVKLAMTPAAASVPSLIQDVSAKEIAFGGSALTPDGRTLVVTGARGVTWIDTATMTAGRHALEQWQVYSVAMTPDGNVLYAVNSSGMIAELSMSGGAPAMFAGAPGQPMALLRVEGSAAP
jgi:hypothetical protein